MKNFKLEPMDQGFCGGVWTSPGFKQLMEELSYDIGPRPTGSKGMQEGQKLLAAKLRKLGVKGVHTEPVPVRAWQEEPSRLELVAPRQRAYESLHCVHSAAGALTAPLVDAGTGTLEDLDRLGRKLDGAVALIGGHVISGAKYVPLPRQVQRISERGGVAVLLRSMYQVGGSPAIELAAVTQPTSIPVIGISYEAGFELAAFARSGKAKVKLECAGKSFSTRCSNLAGELGPSKSQESIILSAHLDTFYLNPGSLDNLTGVITLMEVVRALSPLQTDFQRRLRILIYTGEEYGFLGSQSYVQRHLSELEAIRFVFNMDTLFPATAEGVAVMWSPTMRDYIHAVFQGIQRPVEVRNLFCMSSDYLPFLLQGVPAARPADWRNSMPIWSHTAMDTPDKVNLDWLRMNAMIYAQLLARMLRDPDPLPAVRKTSAEVESLLEKEQVIEAMESFGLMG